jgi:hypothetical protein
MNLFLFLESAFINSCFYCRRLISSTEIDNYVLENWEEYNKQSLRVVDVMVIIHRLLLSFKESDHERIYHIKEIIPLECTYNFDYDYPVSSHSRSSGLFIHFYKNKYEYKVKDFFELTTFNFNLRLKFSLEDYKFILKIT